MKKLYPYDKFISEGIRDKMSPKSDDEIRLGLIERYNINPDIFDFLSERGYKFIKDHETAYRDRWRITIEFRNEEEKHSVYFIPGESLETIKGRIKKNSITTNESIRDQMTPKSEDDAKTEFLKKRTGEMVTSLYLECIETFYPDAPNDSTPIINDKFCDFLKNEIGFDVWKTFVPEFAKYITFDMVLDDLTREQLIKIFEFLYDKKLNESLRDKMTPKPKTEIEQQISSLPIKARIEFISNNRLFDIYTDDEFSSYFKTLPQDELDSFLVYCVMSKRMNAIRILLDCGANPNGIGPFKLTPLYHAVQGSITSQPDINVIKLLLDNGGDPTFPNQRGLTALGHAETWKKPEISELLKRYVKTNESIRDKMTPKSAEEVEDLIGDLVPRAKLEAAVENGVLSIVKKAVEEGADVKMLDKSIFSTACSKGYADVVKFLIDNDFDFHYRQEFALRCAVWSNKLDVVKILLEAGADVNADDKNAIGAAVENCILQNTSLDLIRTLLDYGATPKKRDYDFARGWKKDKEKEPICDDILDIFNEYKPKSYKKINEGVKNKIDHCIVIEVADNRELMRVKGQLENLRDVKFEYNDRMNELTLFPNWLNIDLRWFNEKKIYLNYWSDNSHLYNINELTTVIGKVKNYFEIVDTPNYSPRKLLRDLNEGVRDKMTPKSDDDVKNILSDNNAVDKVKNIFRYNLQHYYTEQELKEVIEKALEYMSFAEQTEFATYHNIPWIIEILYKEGYFEYESILKKTILDAFQRGSIDIVRLLLEKGVDVNYIDTKTLGKYLSPENKMILRKLLRDYKWNLNTLQEGIRDKMTPKSHEDILKVVGKKRPNERLSIGVEQNQPWLVQQALEEGANLHLTDHNVMFLYAVKNNQIEIVSLMVKHGSSVQQALSHAVRQGEYSMVKFLLDNGADPNHTPSILTNACYLGYLRIARLLLDRGADVHGDDDNALYMAVGGGHKDIVEILLKHGANPRGHEDDIIDRSEFFELPKITRLLKQYVKTNESIRAKMTPKSKDDIINTFEEADDVVKKKMIRKLIRDKFRTQDEFFDFVRVVLGISVWGRLSKKLPRHYAFVEDLVNNMKKHETNQIFKAIVNKKNIINESLRDKMTPKSKDEIEDKLRITLNKVLKRTMSDCKEEGVTLPIDIGQTAVSYTTDEIPISQVFEEGTDRMGMGTLTLNPFIKEVMEELLVKYFPKWNEKNIKSFWIGFEEEKEIMYFG